MVFPALQPKKDEIMSDYLLKAAAVFEKVAADNKVPVSAAINIIRQVKESEQEERESRRSTADEAQAIPAAVQAYMETNPPEKTTKEIATILNFAHKQGNLTRISKAVKLLTFKQAAE